MSSSSDTTIGVVRDAARLWPDAEAVVDGETRLTRVAVGKVVKDELRARSALTRA
jgi:hypothetical protein